jgi:hypothetical protein
VSPAGFACPVNVYTVYLYEDALRSQHDHIALTWLLREHLTGKTAAYMTLIAGAIKLSISEKELHNLSYPFKTIPAMIDSAELLAPGCNRNYCACRFLTVDADIEHNEGLCTFKAADTVGGVRRGGCLHRKQPRQGKPAGAIHGLTVGQPISKPHGFEIEAYSRVVVDLFRSHQSGST